MAINIEETQITSEDLLWPPKITISDVLYYSLWVLIIGLLYSILSLALIIILEQKESAIFIFILSLSTFITLLFSTWTVVFMSKLLLPHKYRAVTQVYSAIAAYSGMLYLAMLPIYIISVSRTETESMIYVFIAHILFWVFGSIVITEVLSQYKYLLLSIYSAFFWIFISVFIIILIFAWFKFGAWSLTSLVWILPISLVLTHLFKILLEYVYFNLYKTTWTDPIWAIFDDIKREEKELMDQAAIDLD